MFPPHEARSTFLLLSRFLVHSALVCFCFTRAGHLRHCVFHLLLNWQLMPLNNLYPFSAPPFLSSGSRYLIHSARHFVRGRAAVEWTLTASTSEGNFIVWCIICLFSSLVPHSSCTMATFTTDGNAVANRRHEKGGRTRRRRARGRGKLQEERLASPSNK